MGTASGAVIDRKSIELWAEISGTGIVAGERST